MSQMKGSACRIRFRGLAAIAVALFLLPGGFQARADENLPASVPGYIRTADEIVIDDRYDELSSYSITFRNMWAYTPECFNYAKVTEVEELPTSDGREMNRYRYADEAVLTIPGNTELEYGNRDFERYRQLIAYMESTGMTPGAQAAWPYPLENALARCETIFNNLHISNLVLDQVIALPSDSIRDMTDGIRTFYNTETDCFDAFPEEIGVWYLAFRQQLNGIPSVGTPQVRIALTKDETVLLELNRVIDHVNDDYEVAAGTTWLDAIRVFSDSHCGEEGNGSFEISRINIAYDYDIGDNGTLDARAVPCWQIEGHGSGVGAFKEVYSILDGKKMKHMTSSNARY